MMPVISRVRLEPLSMEGLFYLTADAVWSNVEEGYHVKIPAPFFFNGASVPKWAWPLLDASPTRLVVPGLVHDYLVRCDAKVQWQNPAATLPLTAELAAEIMDDVMIWAGVSAEDRERIGFALKIAAPWYWHKKSVDWRPVLV